MQGAEAPAHHDPSKEATDFVATNKSLRCCFVCRLVKSERQFVESGCDNCPWLELEEEPAKVQDCTTSNFSGLITVMDPKTSWASKWLHLAKYVPGAYAMVINDDIPGAVQDMLEDRGIRVPHAHGQ